MNKLTFVILLLCLSACDTQSEFEATKRLAEKGDVDAQFYLERKYANGDGAKDTYLAATELGYTLFTEDDYYENYTV